MAMRYCPFKPFHGISVLPGHAQETNIFFNEKLNDFSKVEEEYSEAKSIGDDTLVLLNATIQDIDRSLKCFNESKQLAVDANGVANLAYRQAMNASKVRPTLSYTEQAKKNMPVRG